MSVDMPCNGAQAVLRTLTGSGVDACFANPGTSEMHFVAALDSVPDMRGVLCLFEGVVTGAADGYGRMADRPAATLLHLGPGLGNGLANLHNARRAHTPIVNIVGDHATYHKRFDAPLESDVEAVAGSVSGWLRRPEAVTDVGASAAAAVAASYGPPGQVATLILPADVSWLDGATPAAPLAPAAPATVSDDTIESVARVLRSGEPTVILLGGTANRADGLRAASRIGAATGATVFVETFPARLERGAGLPAVPRLGYLAEQVEYQLAGTRHLVLAGARAPVSFFAYPGKPSDLMPPGAEVHVLADLGEDVPDALSHLADLVAAGVHPVLAPAHRPDRPTGALTPQNWTDVIGALLPDNAIISDEANTSGCCCPPPPTARPATTC
jgi:acetolactate synthase-1/2/3 large subunit